MLNENDCVLLADGDVTCNKVIESRSSLGVNLAIIIIKKVVFSPSIMESILISHFKVNTFVIKKN
jgi:hypothetical protein